MSVMSRVHSTTELGSGSPEATPKRKGFGPVKSGDSWSVGGAVVVVELSVVPVVVAGALLLAAGVVLGASLEHAAATPAIPVARKCLRLIVTARFYHR